MPANRRISSAPKLVTSALVLLAVGALYAGFRTFTTKPPVAESVQAKIEGPHLAPPVPFSVPVTPDPRFVRPQVPKLPAVSVPEARHMVESLQNAYRCAHSSNQQTLPNAAPPTDGDLTPDFAALAANLKRALGAMPDACYVNAALPQLANPRTPKALMDVLYDDLLKRPDAIRLRTFFVLASIDSHPHAEDALENLQSLTNTDFQHDWTRWSQAISLQLQRDTHGIRPENCRMH